MVYSAFRALLLVSALGLTLAPSLFPPDISGVWKLDFENEAATESVMVSFSQTDSLLTGHYIGYFGDAAMIAGTMDGKEISFSYDIDGTMVNHFGRLEGNKITGLYHAGQFEQGDFKATRVK